MTGSTSVAMTAVTEARLVEALVRDDDQEDLCMATYRPSTGRNRATALVQAVVPPEQGDRHVHGNATVTADYILRACAIAQEDGSGLVLFHSHPAATSWQSMSGLDRDCESSYANLVRELTGLPLVGMTLATGDCTWSARHWDRGVGNEVDCSHCDSVRVIGDRLAISWNDALRPPPQPTEHQIRTVSAWGERRQADLARRRVLVVGAGSVGLDVIVRLAASGLTHLTVMDFDVVKPHNLDRLIGSSRRDARLLRPKVHVARREGNRASTATNFAVEVSDQSICEPEGLEVALDHDLIFSCVDRPWPRAVLNSLAYSDFIPVIDGGIAVDAFDDGTMRNATWRSHVIRPGRPCMACNGQLELGDVVPEQLGLLDDPTYIQGRGRPAELTGQNVAPLSVSVAAGLLSQYVSFSVAPSGFGDPGPLRYRLSTHELDFLGTAARHGCNVEASEGMGDARLDHTQQHDAAGALRQLARSPSPSIRLLRGVDDLTQAVARWLDRA